MERTCIIFETLNFSPIFLGFSSFFLDFSHFSNVFSSFLMKKSIFLIFRPPEMSKSEHFVSKVSRNLGISVNNPEIQENWQHLIMKPGPSNLALPTTQKFRQTSNGRTMKQTWTCGWEISGKNRIFFNFFRVCRKELSSKRSYTEHMNIHNKSRPFQCEHCVYAAGFGGNSRKNCLKIDFSASQMTLHRHKLRNHTPKAEWGYRCPYCDDAYMEPAGYQQHVQ